MGYQKIIHVAIGIMGLCKNLSWDDRIEEPFWGDSGMADLPHSMKILQDIYFADWRFFCGLQEQIFVVQDD